MPLDKIQTAWRVAPGVTVHPGGPFISTRVTFTIRTGTSADRRAWRRETARLAMRWVANAAQDADGIHCDCPDTDDHGFRFGPAGYPALTVVRCAGPQYALDTVRAYCPLVAAVEYADRAISRVATGTGPAPETPKKAPPRHADYGRHGAVRIPVFPAPRPRPDRPADYHGPRPGIDDSHPVEFGCPGAFALI